MSDPKNFFDQELDRFSLLLFGNLIGAIGVIFLGLTLKIAVVNARNFMSAAVGDRLVSGLILLVSSLLTYWLIYTAYRMVTEKARDD